MRKHTADGWKKKKEAFPRQKKGVILPIILDHKVEKKRSLCKAMGDNKPKTRMRYCELSCTTKGAKEGTNYPKIEGGKKHLQASFKINT